MVKKTNTDIFRITKESYPFSIVSMSGAIFSTPAVLFTVQLLGSLMLSNNAKLRLFYVSRSL